MTALQFFGWFAGLVLGYAILSRGLFLVTDGARQKLVDLGGSLIDRDGVSDDEKLCIRDALHNAHNPLRAWEITGIALKYVFILPFRKAATVDLPGISPMAREDFDGFIVRWFVATMGNSLGATVVFTLLMLIYAALHVSLRSFTRYAITRMRDHRGNNKHATA